MIKIIPLLLLLSIATKSCNHRNTAAQTSKQMVEESSPTNNLTRLHDIWALTAIKDQTVNIEVFYAGVPNLEILISDKQINGFGGCNNYFASIKTLNENDFKLGPISATKKYCEGIDESTFFALLSKVDNYRLNKMQLNLFEGDSLLLSFKKVD